MLDQVSSIFSAGASGTNVAEVLYDHVKLRNLYLEDLKRHYPLQKIGTPEEVFPEEEEEEEEESKSRSQGSSDSQSVMKELKRPGEP